MKRSIVVEGGYGICVIILNVGLDALNFKKNCNAVDILDKKINKWWEEVEKVDFENTPENDVQKTVITLTQNILDLMRSKK